MRHFGLIGKSLSHSFSAKFFNAKFAAEQIDADYLLFELESIDELPQLVANMCLDGFNVTIPYKESVMKYLDEVTAEAQEVGAVNCVELRNGRLIGHNTDIRGIEASLHWLDTEKCEKALILGTGGASKAVQHVLRKLDIEYMCVSRSKERGDITYDRLTPEIIAKHRLIINTTPVGMFPNVDEAPQIEYEHIGSEHRAFDLVYNPANTEFIRRCKEQGAMTMGGMLMLQTQAIASWHIWRGQDSDTK